MSKAKRFLWEWRFATFELCVFVLILSSSLLVLYTSNMDKNSQSIVGSIGLTLQEKDNKAKSSK